MLCIIFGEIPEDMEKKYVYNTSMYFDNTYLDNWLTDDLSVKMIKSVDKAVVLSPNAVDSKALGVIPVTKISGGLKTLLLLRHDDTKIFNASTCGDNCAKWILKIAEKKDLTVYLQHIMHFEGEFKIQIMNTGKVVCNPAEYVKELLEAEEMEDERKLLVQS